MERGVVVGGLMICGSFLLAASLNRSAVKETSPAEPPVVQAPIAPALTRPAECELVAKPEDPAAAVEQPDQGDLPGNGRPACSQ